MNNLTRGGLSPAKITNLIKTSDVVYFMFNPYEFEISRSVTWDGSSSGGDGDSGGEKKKPAGVDTPPLTFVTGNQATISLTLHFDTQESGSPVTSLTSKLWKMTKIDTSTVNAQSEKGNPPPVAFQWGNLYFAAVITKISEKFTLFDESGIPLRCEVS
ncbi:MAG: hypothetical protein AAGK74_13325, partial [Chloroflexota bacterium]